MSRRAALRAAASPRGATRRAGSASRRSSDRAPATSRGARRSRGSRRAAVRAAGAAPVRARRASPPGRWYRCPGAAPAARSRPGRRACARRGSPRASSSPATCSSAAYRASRARASRFEPASTVTATTLHACTHRVGRGARRRARSWSVPGRNPWSTYTAVASRSRARESASNASESAPPEQATTTRAPGSRSSSCPTRAGPRGHRRAVPAHEPAERKSSPLLTNRRSSPVSRTPRRCTMRRRPA